MLEAGPAGLVSYLVLFTLVGWSNRAGGAREAGPAGHSLKEARFVAREAGPAGPKI